LKLRGLQAELWQGLKFGWARGIAAKLNQCLGKNSAEIGTLTLDAAVVVAAAVDVDVVVGGVVNAATERGVACCLDYWNIQMRRLH
jgi:hypothetical protein